MTVHVTAAVRELVLLIARWYDSRPGRYGSAFLDEFEAALARIEASPRACPAAEDGRAGCEDREVFIARFGQRVLFTIVDEEAYVLIVVHANLKEGAWHGKLPDGST
jgi:hypothetical protein